MRKLRTRRFLHRSPRLMVERGRSWRLTARQRQILRFVADGLTSRQIGRHLAISPRTVEVHRYNLMRRLRAHNVAQLIRGALRHRVLSTAFLTRHKNVLASS